ncbi:hypothetical protein EDC01DRAFT_764848 [Geopyxis carbonaria]|nr:hypothetical protein EDC01DRAFT_764848 [Geopyxis carbonaria]
MRSPWSSSSSSAESRRGVGRAVHSPTPLFAAPADHDDSEAVDVEVFEMRTMCRARWPPTHYNPESPALVLNASFAPNITARSSTVSTVACMRASFRILEQLRSTYSQLPKVHGSGPSVVQQTVLSKAHWSIRTLPPLQNYEKAAGNYSAVYMKTSGNKPTENTKNTKTCDPRGPPAPMRSLEGVWVGLYSPTPLCSAPADHLEPLCSQRSTGERFVLFITMLCFLSFASTDSRFHTTGSRPWTSKFLRCDVPVPAAVLRS